MVLHQAGRSGVVVVMVRHSEVGEASTVVVPLEGSEVAAEDRSRHLCLLEKEVSIGNRV